MFEKLLGWHKHAQRDILFTGTKSLLKMCLTVEWKIATSEMASLVGLDLFGVNLETFRPFLLCISCACCSASANPSKLLYSKKDKIWVYWNQSSHLGLFGTVDYADATVTLTITAFFPKVLATTVSFELTWHCTVTVLEKECGAKVKGPRLWEKERNGWYEEGK